MHSNVMNVSVSDGVGTLPTIGMQKRIHWPTSVIHRFGLLLL